MMTRTDLNRMALNPSVCVALVASAGEARSAEEVERAFTAIRDYYKSIDGRARNAPPPIPSPKAASTL